MRFHNYHLRRVFRSDGPGARGINLHTGPQRGGGVQHYSSTDPAGPVAAAIPEGFEIHETPNGQVHLRKKKPARIQPGELALVESELQNQRTLTHRYLTEISDDKIIHEGDTRIDLLREINMRFSVPGLEEHALRNTDYVPVMRFVAVTRWFTFLTRFG